MRRTASEVLRNLQMRIARLEKKSASEKFEIEIVSDHEGRLDGSTKTVDLKGLQSLMEDLESLTLKEIEEYLRRNPEDKFTNEAKFWGYLKSSNGGISLYNGTHTENHELFAYTLNIKEEDASKLALALMGDASKLALTLMKGHPLFKKMDRMD